MKTPLRYRIVRMHRLCQPLADHYAEVCKPGLFGSRWVKLLFDGKESSCGNRGTFNDAKRMILAHDAARRLPKPDEVVWEGNTLQHLR